MVRPESPPHKDIYSCLIVEKGNRQESFTVTSHYISAG